MSKRISVLVLICADNELNIKSAYRLKGLTVFARMKEFGEFNGININDIYKGIELPFAVDARTEGAVKEACKYIIEKTEKQNNNIANNIEIAG